MQFIFCLIAAHQTIEKQKVLHSLHIKLKIYAYPFFSPLFILAVIEFIQLARPVRYILLDLIQVDQEIHGKEFFPEIPAVQLNAQNGFIEILKFPQRELTGEQAETHRVFLYPFLEPAVTGIKYFLVVEGKVGNAAYIMPVQFIVQYFQFMVLHIDQ